MKIYKLLVSMISLFLLLFFSQTNIHADTDSIFKGCKNSPVKISLSNCNENDIFTFECTDNCNFQSQYTGFSGIQINDYFLSYSKNYELIFSTAGEHNIVALKNRIPSSRAKIIIAENHSYGDMQIKENATCTEDGIGEYICSNCQNSYTEKIPATKHNYTEKITQKQSCTEDGIKTFTCSNCYDSYTEKIPATKHNYTEKITQKQSCTEDGIKTFTCSNCYNSYTEKIPAIGHAYVKTSSKKPTCIKDGVENYTCTNCGQSSKKILSAIGHSYSKWTIIKKATIFSKGKKTRHCLKCNARETIMFKKLPSKVSISKNRLYLKIGQQSDLKIKTKTKGDKILYWKSSKNNIVSINKKTGKLKALGHGTALITLKMKSGCTATCIVYAYDTRIKLPEKNPNLRFILTYPTRSY